jgi:hypothetical protein
MHPSFVRQARVDGKLIEVSSALAGHASIDATLIDSTQEPARQIMVVRSLKRRRPVGANIEI